MERWWKGSSLNTQQEEEKNTTTTTTTIDTSKNKKWERERAEKQNKRNLLYHAIMEVHLPIHITCCCVCSLYAHHTTNFFRVMLFIVFAVCFDSNFLLSFCQSQIFRSNKFVCVFCWICMYTRTKSICFGTDRFFSLCWLRFFAIAEIK